MRPSVTATTVSKPAAFFGSRTTVHLGMELPGVRASAEAKQLSSVFSASFLRSF
jgi:hypothetical protein